MTDKKTQAIIARLASEHDGEVIAAARALQRMAEAKGLKLWEFLTTRDQQAHVQSNGGAAGGSTYSSARGFYGPFNSQAYKEMEEFLRKAREAARKADEQAYGAKRKAKAEAKRKAEEEIYERMKQKSADPFEQAYYDLRDVWSRDKSNWADLRDRLAQAVVKKGSDHLTTWEKEFLLDIFQRPNLSPTQRQKAEQIYNNRF